MDNKIKMILNWQGQELEFVVDRIDIPKYEIVPDFPWNKCVISGYDTIYDTSLYLNKDFMYTNYYNIMNNGAVKFFIKKCKEISSWAEDCQLQLRNMQPHKQDIVGNGILQDNLGHTKNIKNALIVSYDMENDGDYIIEADF